MTDPERTITLRSDQDTPLTFTVLDDRTDHQALVDAGAFASRMGSVKPTLISLKGGPTPTDREQVAPVDWEATSRQRERELRKVGEARHIAEQRITDALEVIHEWQRIGPPNDHLTRVHRALRPPVSGTSVPITSDDTPGATR